MPSAYTHYRFGKEVLSCLPKHYRRPIEEYRELFDIGLHGPDILFYYKPLTQDSVNQTGRALHKASAKDFFANAEKIWQNSQSQDALKAYLYGFICHFALDSICHPYIQKILSVNEFNHNELETELDRYFMIADGLDPMTYIPIQHIHATDANSSVIAECFENISETEIKASLRSMILCFKLLNAPADFKRNLLRIVLKIARQSSLYGLVMKPEANEACQKYSLLLKNKYMEAVTTAASLIQQYDNVLEHGANLSSRFDMTFGAGENWEHLYI